MAVILKEKVRRPEPGGLPRERLEGPLLSRDGPTVALVVAPAGSGKTTLLARVAAASEWAAAWYLAGPEDRTEEALCRHLTHALSAVLSDPLPAASKLDELVNTLEAGPAQPVQLIVDDVHELIQSPAELALERFLWLRPPHIRVLLGTRRPLAINTPRLMVSGNLVELDSDALRFRSWEVEELFRAVYGEPLSPETAAALTRHTGGWAAGLKLFHLATMGKSDAERARAVAQLAGRSRLFRSYLTWNVLEELAPERRTFLLQTSTLGILTGPLCDALLQRTGSAAILEELERQQFFTSAAEDGQSYRYHQVLQTHLESLLIDELGSQSARELHARSARLLEEAGQLRHAMRAYALADDWASVARLLQQTSAGMPVADHHSGSGSGSALPTDDPWLALVRARRLLRSGSVAAAVAAYRVAETLLDDPDFQARCAEERGLAAVWGRTPVVLGARSTEQLASTRGAAEAVRQATQRLRPAAPAVVVPFSSRPLADGVVQLLSGNVSEAITALSGVSSTATSRSFDGLSARLALALAEILDGAGAGIVGRLEEVMLSAEVEEQPWLARLARGLQASVLMVTKPAAWRADACATLVAQCTQDGDEWGALLLAMFSGAAHARLGNDQQAEAWLGRAASGAADLGALVLAAWAGSLAARSSTRLRRPDAETRTQQATAMLRTAGLSDVQALLDQAFGPTPSVTTYPPGVRVPAEKPGPPAISLCCLGNFSITADGAPITLPLLRPRPRALLLLLAINHSHDVHREILIDALWPDAPLEAATHRLQVAASNVRQCLATARLGEGTIQRHGDAYRLQLIDASLDVTEFEDQLRRAARAEADGDVMAALTRWTAAVEMYRGDLLPELGPTEWVLGERERLRLAAAGAAVAAAGLNLRLGRPTHALPAARRAVDLDPLRDTSWLLLADVQESLGDTMSAAMTRQGHAQICAELNLTGQRPAQPVSRPALATRSGPDASRERV